MLLRRILTALLAGACLVCVSIVHAHEIRPAVATASFTHTHVRLEVSLNLEAAMAGVAPAHRDTDESPNAQSYNKLRAMSPEALRARFRKFESQYLEAVKTEFDGRPSALRFVSLDIPAIG
ncbi:MAG TPA: hypothetical protein VJ733_12090, partial [Candidatus Binatia bacterium]|nr:hypothetical protein [Candidatus Binatia bacterium]